MMLSAWPEMWRFALLAIFPFLIFTSSLTAFIGDRAMAEDLIAFLIAIVPPALVEPIVAEVRQVMTVQRGGVLSIGILLTIWFAVGGVDGVRVGLNRAYGIRETRSTVVLYAVQAAMVIVASLVLVLVGYLLVLAPRAGSWLHTLMPSFDPASITVGLIRYPAAGVILVAALFAAHVFCRPDAPGSQASGQASCSPSPCGYFSRPRSRSTCRASPPTEATTPVWLGSLPPSTSCTSRLWS